MTYRDQRIYGRDLSIYSSARVCRLDGDSPLAKKLQPQKKNLEKIFCIPNQIEGFSRLILAKAVFEYGQITEVILRISVIATFNCRLFNEQKLVNQKYIDKAGAGRPLLKDPQLGFLEMGAITVQKMPEISTELLRKLGLTTNILGLASNLLVDKAVNGFGIGTSLLSERLFLASKLAEMLPTVSNCTEGYLHKVTDASRGLDDQLNGWTSEQMWKFMLTLFAGTQVHEIQDSLNRNVFLWYERAKN